MRALCCLACTLAACGGPTESQRVELPVVVDGTRTTAMTTNLGYDIELSDARMVIADVAFTIAGEEHATLSQQLKNLVIGTAYAHPGHYQGGEVTGEMQGRYIVDWVSNSGGQMAMATLLEGDYEAANFLFASGTADDGLSVDDPLLGHTAIFAGTAQRDGQTVTFTAVIDAPADRVLVGAPFEAHVTQETGGSIGFQLLTQDPYEDDTLFDDVDFFALDDDRDDQVHLDQQSAQTDAYQQLRRRTLTHDHYDFANEAF